jgi:hypothetical protein
LLPIFGNAQVIDGKTYSPFNNYYKWRGGAFDTTLLIPRVASPNGKRPGAVRYSDADSSIYSWTGNQWIRVTGYDTSSLSSRIEQRVRYSDTSSMLSGYLLNAYNGLTKVSKDVKLGGSLTENTSINLNTRNLSIITGGDTTRFFPSGTMSVAGSPSNASAAYKLNVFGSTWTSDDLVIGSPLGNSFNINTTSTIASGFTGPGIYRRTGNPYSTYFMETNQGGSKDKWAFISQFGGYDSVPRSWVNTNSSIININMGWGSPNQSGLSASTLLIDPRINVDSVGGGVGNNFDNIKIRGVYYAPKLNKLDGVTHVGFENTTGGNMFNSVSGNTRIGYSTFDTTYKLDVNGHAKVFRTLTVGSTDRDTINDQYVNIYSDKEILAKDGFFLAAPNNAPRIKTGMDRTSNTLRLWSGNAPIAYVNYLGGSSNSFDFKVADQHNTGAGLSGNVNTVEIAGSLLNIYGSNTTVHNQIAILPQIIDSFGIGKWRGIYYNPDVQYLGVPLNHIAYENTVGNNLLNTTSGNTLIGTSTDNASAILNVSSTTQGFLPPRMTGAQAELINSPAEGLMIYSTNGNGTTITSKGWWGFDGTNWVKLN